MSRIAENATVDVGVVLLWLLEVNHFSEGASGVEILCSEIFAIWKALKEGPDCTSNLRARAEGMFDGG